MKKHYSLLAVSTALVLSLSFASVRAQEVPANAPVSTETTIKDQASELADKAADAASEAKEAVEEKAGELADKAADTAGEVKEAVEEKAGELADKTADAATEAKETVEEKAGELADKAADAATEAKEAVEEKAGELADKAADTATEAKEAVEEAVSGEEALNANSILLKTDWGLVRIKDANGKTIAKPNNPANFTLSFLDENRAGLRVNCNRGTTSWTENKEQALKFGVIGITKALCKPNSPVEPAMVQSMEKVTSYKLDEKKLFLTAGEDNRILEFRPVSVKREY